ncbi:MAG: CocE/NonD family hydrolase [Betaproteobacteria bacterium]|nr:CocE/NonD family hydrolase [Betaproteobacteria bacterium]
MTNTPQPRHELLVEKDVEIPLRDGVCLRADVFRPKGGGRFPALINIGAYQKDKLWVPPADLEEKPNPYMNWETVNPLWWVPRGYAAVRVDTRGSGKSPGMTDPFSVQEAIDFYDAIEWSARQSWCSGRVATMGISYFAMTQWFVANLRPPSLKAIIPWEGAADMYRDFAYHGGIFCFGFVSNWYNNHMAHHLLGRRDQTSPDAFSKHWLWHYMRDSLDTGIMQESPVKLLIRTGGGKRYRWRRENEWPLRRTRWTRFYLKPAAGPGSKDGAAEGALSDAVPKRSASLTYPASGMTKAGVASASWTSTALAGSLPRMGVSFETAPLAAELEVTGPVNLVLWVSSTTADMDIFATLRNIDAEGKDVWEIGQQQQPVPVAKGWLRVSHRKLDPRLSLPYRPYHSHDERQWLKPGEKVQVQVEIWPTCMVFSKGHRIRLDIQPRDGVGSAPYTHYSADYNAGDNTIFTGGSTASHLLLPVIPRT